MNDHLNVVLAFDPSAALEAVRFYRKGCFQRGRQEAVMNSAQRRGLTRLMLRWPQRRTELSESCGQNPQVLELSEAYEAACGAADYWAKSSSPEGLARAEEYRVLAFEIEADIDALFWPAHRRADQG